MIFRSKEKESPKSKREIVIIPEMLSKFKNLHGRDEFENWNQEDVIFVPLLCRFLDDKIFENRHKTGKFSGELG